MSIRIRGLLVAVLVLVLALIAMHGTTTPTVKSTPPTAVTTVTTGSAPASTQAPLLPTTKPPVALGLPAEEFPAWLNQEVTVRFQQSDLRDVIESIRSSTHAPITLDPKVPTNLAPVTIHTKNMKMRYFLQYIERIVELTHVMRNGSYVLVVRENAASPIEACDAPDPIPDF
jgi:type II secretory pathway component GspD/PulD (secretin)